MNPCKYTAILFFTFLITACGGGGGGSPNASSSSSSNSSQQSSSSSSEALELGIIDIDENLPEATAYIINAERDQLYITHKADLSLSLLNLKTGSVTKTISFDHMPERMALSPDGNKLYVALLTQEHSSYVWEEDQAGFIAVINLQSQAVETTFAINTDPYDLVVTSDNKLIVSSGSGQWTNIYAFNASTGAVLGQAFIRQASRLALHPSENWVFAADTDSSPSDIEKFDISGVGIVATGDSPYHGDHRMDGNVWATPDGKYLVTRGGDLFLASNMTYEKSITDFATHVVDVSFDPENKLAFLTLSNGVISVVNTASFEEVTQVDIFGDLKYVAISNGYLYSIVSSGGFLSLVREAHPCPDCGSNQAPVANISYTPASGDTTTTYEFDAATSTDPEGGLLDYRWDIGADGTWDTCFSTSSLHNKKFLTAGTKYIRVQVKDPAGLTAIKTIQVNVAQGVDVGVELGNGAAYELSFDVTDVGTDKQRSKLYISDKTAKRLYVVNLATGFTEKYFEFDQMPERMALSPDGTKLYVALLEQEHSAYWWEEEQSGYIATIDLVSQTVVKIFEINTDPFDLVVTNDNKLIVSSGSGQWTNLYAYNADTGVEIAHAGGIYQGAYLTINTAQNWVFASDTSLSPSDVHKYHIGATTITSLGDSPYHGDHRIGGKIWSTPDGMYLITQGGDMFLASNMTYVRSLLDGQSSIIDLTFDADAQVVLLARSNGNLDALSLSSYELISSQQIAGEVKNISIVGADVYLTTTNLGINGLVQIDHPCPNCADNLPPTAEFTVDPVDGDTTDTYTFDASGSNDPDGGDLSYRWDIDNDGTWDAAFSAASSLTQRFYIAGDKTVTLQIKDEMGSVHSVSQTFSVAQGTDYGISVNSSTPYVFDFTVSHTATDALENKLYVSDKTAKRVYVVDLLSGETEKYFEFDQMPERMALSPDGTKLYVALLTQEHSSYWWDGQQSGFIATVDLSSQAIVKIFEINTDPFDLVVTEDNKLIVSSGSGQWTNLRAFNVNTGAELSSVYGLYEGEYLASHPTQNWVFTSYFSSIRKYLIGDNTIEFLGDSLIQGGDGYGKFWLDPDGTYLLTRGGGLYLSLDMTYHKSLNSAVRDAVWNDSLLITIDHQAVISLIDKDSLEVVTMLQTTGTPIKLIAHGLDLILIHEVDGQVILTNLAIGDHDEDGMPQWWEDLHGLSDEDPLDADLDNDSDGLYNFEEFAESTLPNNADSDEDDINDGDEVNLYSTNPVAEDSDADLLNDFDEVFAHLTNPVGGDSDDDGFSDYMEVIQYMTDPNDINSIPPALTIMNESFEEEDIPEFWVSTTNSDVDWYIDSTQSLDGTQSLRSGAIADGQNSGVKFSTLFAAGTLQFYTKIESEGCCDHLMLYVDGSERGVSYSSDWASVSIELSAGVHEIEFRYVKDGSVSSGADAVWIDNVTFSAN